MRCPPRMRVLHRSQVNRLWRAFMFPNIGDWTTLVVIVKLSITRNATEG